jgi:hypothetical protein
VSGQSDRPRGALPLFVSPWVAVALPVAGVGVSYWALALLLPYRGHGPLVFLAVFGLMAVVRVVWRDDQDKAVVRAIARRVDPGPDLWERTAAWARAAQHPRMSDRWGPLVVAGGLAVACIVVAVVRPSLRVVLPAPFLLTWCAVAEAARRRSVERAARWLADPPVSPAA